MKTRWPKTMTVAEFQERIRQQCGIENFHAHLDVCKRVGAQLIEKAVVKPSNPLLTRKPTDLGFYPARRCVRCNHDIGEYARGLRLCAACADEPKTKQNGGK